MKTTWKIALPAILIALFVGPLLWGNEPQDPRPTRIDGGVAFDDPLEPFVPLRPRSGANEDRMKALSLYAAGRVAEQKQDNAQALKCYERAYRYDPQSGTILAEIVSLAFTLDRSAEALRYARLWADHDSSDPVLLRRLAMVAAEEDDIERAIDFYEKALAAQKQEGQSPAIVMLSMDLGRMYFLAGKFNKAAESFAYVNAALEKPREHGLNEAMKRAILTNRPEMALQLFGESFLEAKRADDAKAVFEKAHETRANEGQNAYNLARVARLKKQYEEALTQLQTFLEKKTPNQGIAPYQFLVDVLAEMGQPEQAIERLEKLRVDDENNVPLSYFLAKRYIEAADYDKALPILKALTNRPRGGGDNPQGRGQRGARSGPPAEAFQGLVEVHLKKKDAPQVLAALAETFDKLGGLAPLGDITKSVIADEELMKAIVAAAQQQLTADPPTATFGSAMSGGLMAMEIRDYAAAKDLYEAAIKEEPSKKAEVLLTWGLELLVSNEHKLAAEVFQRGVDEKVLPSSNPRFHFYLAGALEMSGRTDDALVAARKAAEIAPDSPQYLIRVGWVEYHAKNYDAARKSYQAVVDKYNKSFDPPELRDIMRDAKLVLSNLCSLDGKQAEAEEWLEQVLDEFPEDAGALNDLGYLWADANKHLERSLVMCQKAVKEEPDNAAFRDSLGWVLFRLGRFDEAVVELTKAVEAGDPDGVILEHLADAQAQSGKTAAAIETWTRAAEKFEKNAEAAKAKAVREKIAKAQAEPAKS